MVHQKMDGMVIEYSQWVGWKMKVPVWTMDPIIAETLINVIELVYGVFLLAG